MAGSAEDSRAAGQLYLATVVVRVEPGDPGVASVSATVSDALMAHPDVVTVRPEFADAVWLFRMDVWGRTSQEAVTRTAAPVEAMSRATGLAATVMDVRLMGEAEKRRFHHPFYEQAAGR
jgi:hypothetical protein